MKKARATKRQQRPGRGWLIALFVLIALLVLLLRLAEFAGHRVRHPRPRAVPAILHGTDRDFHAHRPAFDA